MSSKSDTRVPKPPKPPEKPLMPYMRYSRKVWEQVKNSNPHLKLWEVGKIIGQMWRELPDDEKTLYVEEYDAEKAQYAEALRQYHSSPAYQAWLVAKERAEKSMEEQDQERKQASARVRDRMGEIPQTDLRESYILEDNEEDAEDQYTAKHVAAARFQRNHRLMQEILSDSRLPDPGQLITQSRLNTLRLQVEQLKSHKRNLCQEIESCEARHRAKLKRIQEDSSKFLEGYQKLTSERPMITESQFAEMIVKAKHDLQREEEERLSRYLVEVETRRRRQQQRQQREAELSAEAERRRQQIHQQQVQQAQARMQQIPDDAVQQPNDRFVERPVAQQDIKDEPSSQAMPKPGATPGPVSVKPNIPEANSNTTGSYPPSMPNNFSQVAGSGANVKFNPSGHTQHHYPPPPNYPPNAMSPVNQPVGLMPQRMPSGPPQQGVLTTNVPKASPLTQPKKTPSSGSSASSASSISSSSSKTRKSDSAPESKDKKVAADVISTASMPSVVNERRDPNLEHAKGMEGSAPPGPPGDYAQNAAIQPPISRPATQHYPQQPPVPPNASMQGHPLTGVPHGPFIYEQNAMPGSPMTGGGYYHHPSMPQPANNPPNYPPHARPPFPQHPSYGTMQYPPHQPQPQTSEHPPPPPMYIQHMPQQPHLSQPGPPMMGSSPQTAGHPPHSHQNTVVGWHQSGGPSGYPPQYAPPRYPGPNAPMGYPPHPVRHMPISGGSYVMPPHQSIPQGSQQPQQVSNSTPMSEPSGAGQQQIPAPPPYQQQQSNMTSGYWVAPQNEYGTASQPPSQQYMPTSHQDSGSLAPPAVSMENMPPSSISGRPHTEHGPGHMGQQSQQPNMYYSGYPPIQSPYGQPNNMGSGGFYGVPPQHQSGNYPPPPSHGAPAAWPGYPSQMGQPHPHGYQPPSQQQSSSSGPPSSAQMQGKVDSSGPPSSSIENSASMATVTGNTSRPSSVGSQSQPPCI
ncbi:unnamed protein product [Calicophoron daubneyi]|uniref:HMG box domain-containing protein n=1 Tax=Calicophoron daubneyi TaxID=300641 RepID=A0AAV2TZ65_CALDB